MTSEMLPEGVEKVARAICLALHGKSDARWKSFTDVAKVAMRAMPKVTGRTPSPAPAGMAEIVAAAEAYRHAAVEDEKAARDFGGKSPQWERAKQGRAIARARFLALVAAHEAEVARIAAVVDEQANDPGLWFQAETAAEAYVQQALRQLHAAIEGKTPEECAADLRRRVTGG